MTGAHDPRAMATDEPAPPDETKPPDAAVEDFALWLAAAGAEPDLRRWARERRLADPAAAWAAMDRADWMLTLLPAWRDPDDDPALAAALRRFAAETAARFARWFPGGPEGGNDGDPRCAAAVAAALAVADGPGGLLAMTAAGNAAREACEQARAAGNWVAARAGQTAAAATAAEPLAAAREASEQAGMTAQYTDEFPASTDWIEEMRTQAAALKQLVAG